MFSPKRIVNSKKAGEKVLSIWWFFVLAFVGVSVVAAVSMFYSADVDVKEIEAGILADRVADCIVQNGYLSSSFIGGNFKLKECGLNEEVIQNSQNFYIGISAYDFSSCNEKMECKGKIGKLNFSAGMSTMPENCRIKEAEEKKGGKAEYFPRCSEKSFVALNRRDKTIPEKLILKIVAGSNQRGGILA
ncbi:MAG TPA: hypothetical protein VJA86_04360 [Candidatus Nanoarchaeia archaeon]|nr:hypothetical protein [Candidatus Nanoarchaeia archaeon]